ncbi:hypothetical protein WM26_24740 [Burkholderia cepacia]|nr:hypothetical protein WM26_24740 [Burkholderia cepacia]
MHKLPRLYQSRHGVYYLRVIQNKQKIRRSLGTKDFHQARISVPIAMLVVALLFMFVALTLTYACLNLSVGIKPY